MTGDIQFEDDQDAQFLYSRVQASSKTPKLVQAVADKLFGGDSRRATAVLLGAAVVIVILAILWPIVFRGSNSSDHPPLPAPPDNYRGSK